MTNHVRTYHCVKVDCSRFFWTTTENDLFKGFLQGSGWMRTSYGWFCGPHATEILAQRELEQGTHK